mgnify:CR=1 FL=1
MKKIFRNISTTFALILSTSYLATAQDQVYLELPQGWSMFGYTCPDSVDAMVGFSEISDKIEIVKDEWGLSYLPSWEFNAMGSLHFSEGYQIKMIEEVADFQFCEAIVPEDGIGQTDVDASYADGVASVDITSDNQAVFDEGAASVTPEDGITQADVDAVQQQLNTANQTISELQAEGDWNYPPENYFWYWEDVEQCLEGEAYSCAAAAEYLANYNAPQYNIAYEISSCVNVAEMGWDLFYASQYSCTEALNHPLLLAEFFGTPDYEFELDDCGVHNGDNSTCTDECGVLNGDNSCIDECGVINGDNSSCTDECGVLNGDNSSCADECGVPNGDNSSCTDCAGVLNGTSQDLDCGCIPAGYGCDGNALQIGDQHEGGIVFQINEDGTGLVADLQDSGQKSWNDAVNGASSATSQGYDDWYLPNIDICELMYNTIGQGVDNAGGFTDNYYWSSSEYSYYHAWYFNFNNGLADRYDKDNPVRVRVIRAF